jgi:hypothetical protein
LRGLVSESGYAGPLVVDMESYDAVAEAAARGVPATVLRAVSDAHDEALPSFLERCRRPDGDLDRRRVVLHAMVRPGSIRALFALRRSVRAGASVLGELMARLLPVLGSPAG